VLTASMRTANSAPIQTCPRSMRERWPSADRGNSSIALSLARGMPLVSRHRIMFMVDTLYIVFGAIECSCDFGKTVLHSLPRFGG
jgi:hypothetical protein